MSGAGLSFWLMDSWLHKWVNINNSTTHDDIIFVTFLFYLEIYMEKNYLVKEKFVVAHSLRLCHFLWKGISSGCNEGGNNSFCLYIHKTTLKRSQVSWKISICIATFLSVIFIFFIFCLFKFFLYFKFWLLFNIYIYIYIYFKF